jgi:hypothetical protein
MAYDMFPIVTLQEKKIFLEWALKNDHILFFQHDPENECCKLELTEKGIRPKGYFKLNTLQ